MFDHWFSQTIAILPLQPLGVVQFGSHQQILENLDFVGKVKDMIQNPDFLSELLTCGDFFPDSTDLMQTGISHEDEALALLERQLLQAIESPAENSDHDLFSGMDFDLTNTTANCSNPTSSTLLDCIPELDMGFLEKDFFTDCFNLQKLVNSSSTVANPTTSANTVNSSYNSCSSACATNRSTSTAAPAATPSTTASRSKKPLEDRRDVLARKKVKPGESTRPRPKDRQLIQDRVKELREIVPNGSKVINIYTWTVVFHITKNTFNHSCIDLL